MLILINYIFVKIVFANIIPIITPNKLNERFKKTFNEHIKYLPSKNKSTVSRLNVENVLSPPSKPVVKNNLFRDEIKLVCLSIPIINPINIPAITFESNVPKGKFIPIFLQTMLNRYRRHEPKKPPIPTYTKFNRIPPCK